MNATLQKSPLNLFDSPVARAMASSERQFFVHITKLKASFLVFKTASLKDHDPGCSPKSGEPALAMCARHQHFLGQTGLTRKLQGGFWHRIIKQSRGKVLKVILLRDSALVRAPVVWQFPCWTLSWRGYKALLDKALKDDKAKSALSIGPPSNANGRWKHRRIIKCAGWNHQLSLRADPETHSTILYYKLFCSSFTARCGTVQPQTPPKKLPRWCTIGKSWAVPTWLARLDCDTPLPWTDRSFACSEQNVQAHWDSAFLKVCSCGQLFT